MHTHHAPVTALATAHSHAPIATDNNSSASGATQLMRSNAVANATDALH